MYMYMGYTACSDCMKPAPMYRSLLPNYSVSVGIMIIIIIYDVINDVINVGRIVTE